MKTRIVPGDEPSSREEAVAVLRDGGVVALPTETVYGLAADALNPEAVARVFEAKERPRFDPLILHVPEDEWLEKVTDVPAEDVDLVQGLVKRFWPGPLTLVLPRKSIVPDIVAAGLPTVAVRRSAHPVFGAVVRHFGGPLAAPSANRFGRISPTAADHVLAELADRIPLIVDGGPTLHGLESTVVAVRRAGLEILRAGPVSAAELGEMGEVRRAKVGSRLEAPGQTPSHYAPGARLVLVPSLANFEGERRNAAALAFRGANQGADFAVSRTLSAGGDLREAAANLFRLLRELDDARVEIIVAEAVPEEGIGIAIMDRLRRAAVRSG